MKTYPDLARFPLISNSDAHFLKDIGRAHTVFDAADPSLPALVEAAPHGAFQRPLPGMPMVEDICFHLIDLVQNSVAAGARTIRLAISESASDDSLTLEVADDGRGMDPQTLEKVQDPFFTTKSFKKVGLGIPLLKATAQACRGDFLISSRRAAAPGPGAAAEQPPGLPAPGRSGRDAAVAAGQPGPGRSALLLPQRPGRILLSPETSPRAGRATCIFPIPRCIAFSGIISMRGWADAGAGGMKPPGSCRANLFQKPGCMLQ